MKLYSILIAVILVVNIAGCSKQKNAELNLTGHWKMIESTDDYNKGSFEHYTIVDDLYLNIEMDNNQQITMKQQNDVLFTGKFNLTDDQKEIQVVENKNQILYKFTIVNYTTSTLKVAYKTSNGTYIHLFERK